MNTPPTALITGAARRIGRAIALDLARTGWRVAIHHNRSGADAEAAVEEIEAAGGAAMALQADLADQASLERLIPECVKQIGAPICLVNNASLFEQDAIETLTAENWRTQMNVNLRAPVFLSQAFARHLPQDAQGVIINMLDQRVWKLTPDFFSYTLSKSALWTATRTLAQALAPGIRVNAIGPGPALPSRHQSQEDFARQRAATILQRGPAADEICAAVRFILDAPSMTGQMIALDGGQHLAWRTPDISPDNE